MSDGDEDDEIDELREQTRGTDRISADAGNGTEDGEKERKDEREQLTQEQEKEQVGVDTKRRKSESGSPTPSKEFEGAFEERAGRTESGIDPRTVSATDSALSALLLALQDTDELDEVGGAIADELGAPAPPEYDRDAVVRLAVAYALRDTAPEYFEKLAERV